MRRSCPPPRRRRAAPANRLEAKGAQCRPASKRRDGAAALGSRDSDGSAQRGSEQLRLCGHRRVVMPRPPAQASLELDGNQLLAGGADGLFADGSCGGPAARRALEARDGVLQGLGLLLRGRTTLTRLGLANNDLGDSGLSAVVEAVGDAGALADLDLARNAGAGARRGWMSRSGPALGRLIAGSSTLTALNLQWNTLAGPGASDIARSLLRNTTLTTLNLGWNCFGKSDAIDCLGESLAGVAPAAAGKVRPQCLVEPACRLRDLDLSFNAINDRKALHLAECLACNSTLMHLRLDGNPLMISGVLAIRRIASAREGDGQPPLAISMESCRASSKTANAFDALHPSGSYVLDLSLEYDRVLVRKLVQLAQSGEGEFISSNMTLNEKPFHLILHQKQDLAQRRKSLVIGKNSGPMSARGVDNTGQSAKRALASMQSRLTERAGKLMCIPGTNLPLFGILRFDFGETDKPPVTLL